MKLNLYSKTFLFIYMSYLIYLYHLIYKYLKKNKLYKNDT